MLHIYREKSCLSIEGEEAFFQATPLLSHKDIMLSEEAKYKRQAMIACV